MNLKKIIREEIDDLDLKWIQDVEITMDGFIGSCFKADNGTNYIIKDIKGENVLVKSQRGGSKQTWGLTSLYHQNQSGRLIACNGRILPKDTVPVPPHLKERLREEVDNLDWIKNVEAGYTGVDVSKDYWGAWKFLSGVFIELGLYDLDGRVVSSDYDGIIEVLLSINNRFHLSVFIRTIYQELNGVVEVHWNIHGYSPISSNFPTEHPPYSGSYNDGELRGKKIFQPVEEAIKKYLKTYLKESNIKINEGIDDFDWIDVGEPEITKRMRFRCPGLNPDGSLYSWIDVIGVAPVNTNEYGEPMKEVVFVTYRMESGMGELQIRSRTVSKEKFLKSLKRLECIPMDDIFYKTLK